MLTRALRNSSLKSSGPASANLYRSGWKRAETHTIRRKVESMERGEWSSEPIFWLAGMWIVCINRLGQHQPTRMHLATPFLKAASVSISLTNSVLAVMERVFWDSWSPSFFTGTKAEYRLKSAFLPHSLSSFAVAGASLSKDWKLKPHIHWQSTSRESRAQQCHHTALSHSIDGSTYRDGGACLETEQLEPADGCLSLARALCSSVISSPLWVSVSSAIMRA